MMSIKQSGNDFYLKIGTSFLYNLDATKFNCIYISESDGSAVNVTEDFSEIISPVDGNTTTCDEIEEGSFTITVADGSVFGDGDVVKIDSNYYYIRLINGNSLTFSRQTSAHLADTEVEQVGNTGVYKVLMNIPDAGKYTAFISNATVDMINTPHALDVQDAIVDDIAEKLDSLTVKINESSFI